MKLFLTDSRKKLEYHKRNKNEESIVNVMGRRIIETLNKQQKKMGVSYEEAETYLTEYSKQFV